VAYAARAILNSAEKDPLRRKLAWRVFMIGGLRASHLLKCMAAATSRDMSTCPKNKIVILFDKIYVCSLGQGGEWT